MEQIFVSRSYGIPTIVLRDTFERAPDNLNPEARELLQGVYKQKDRLLLILDTKKTIGFAGGTH